MSRPRLEAGVELVLPAEIGRRLGVSRERVRQWTLDPRKGFPAPCASVGRARVWEWGAVAAWARANGRAVNGRETPVPAALPAARSLAGRAGRGGPFVGRSAELAELAHLLDTSHVVTLVGAPGIGKTRLAAELVDRLGPRWRHGTCRVELAPVGDAVHVAPAVAAALGVTGPARGSALDAVVLHLRERELLLVLDNCEHLLRPCAELTAAIAHACPRVTVLATSQTRLGAPAEAVWQVPPLAVAPSGGEAEADAVRLFCERAWPGSEPEDLDAEAQAVVRRICHALDGIPLAIELAAARVTVLTPSEIATRLEHRFSLLTQPGPDAAPQHRTLRTAFDWSHALLSPTERALFRRLAVFTGGCDLESIESVCAQDGGDVLDALAGLVGKSLVVADTSGRRSRYHLLETVRLYGLTHLESAGEEDAVRLRHASRFADLAEQAETGLTGPQQREWLERLDREQGNLRGALGWTIATDQAALTLRLAGALPLYWRMRGACLEGRRWGAEALERADGQPARLRARALMALGFMALMLDDIRAAVGALDEALVLVDGAEDSLQARCLLLLGNAWLSLDGSVGLARLRESADCARAVGDAWCRSHALGLMGSWHALWGNLDMARPLLEEGLATARAAGDDQGLRISLGPLGELARTTGDLPLAETLLQESLEVARRLGEPYGTAVALVWLGEVAIDRGDLEEASRLLTAGLAEARQAGTPAATVLALCARGRLALAGGRVTEARAAFDEAISVSTSVGTPSLNARHWLAAVLSEEGDLDGARILLEEGLASSRRAGNALRVARVQHQLGEVARRQGLLGEAANRHQEALEILARLGARREILLSLEAIALLAADAGDHARATRLVGAIDALRHVHGFPRLPIERARWAQACAVMSPRVPQTERDRLQREGASLSLPAAVAVARRGRGARTGTATGWASLTRTELEVARLVAEGLSNGEIATRQFISPRTVAGHLSRSFAKLGIRSRTQLARLVSQNDPAATGAGAPAGDRPHPTGRPPQPPRR